MRKMSSKEQKEYVEKMTKERSEIQAKIAELNAQRKKYVAEQMKKQHGSDKTLGSAAIISVREQAKKRNFKFKSEK
jgi:ribosomal protein S24E